MGALPVNPDTSTPVFQNSAAQANQKQITHDSITVPWIAGRKDVGGNELANKEAKTAAEDKKRMRVMGYHRSYAHHFLTAFPISSTKVTKS